MQNVKQKDSYRIYKAALEAVDSYYATKAKMRRVGNVFKIDGVEYDLRNFDNIYIVGAGKDSAYMAKAVEDMLADKNIGGRIIVKEGCKDRLERIVQVEAGYPLEDEIGVLATRKTINLLEKAGQNDLIITIISDGASVLMSSPAAGLTLEDMRKLIERLYDVGADKKEISILRRHTSMIKGGRFVQYAYPAKVVSLILSDVLDDDLEVVSSGLTVADSSTYLDAMGILKKYEIYDKMPQSIINHFSKGLRGENLDAPKKGDRIYGNVQNVIIASLKQALKKAEEEADFMNYKVYVLSDHLTGDVSDAVNSFSQIMKTNTFKVLPLKRPCCIIAGGKTTVKVKGEGKGDRNTELALLMAKELEGMEKVEFLSCGTDGDDDQTDAVGAICNGETMLSAKKLKLDFDEYLENSDSYSFFEKVGGLVKTGSTKTDVNDIQILLLK